MNPGAHSELAGFADFAVVAGHVAGRLVEEQHLLAVALDVAVAVAVAVAAEAAAAVVVVEGSCRTGLEVLAGTVG